MYRFPPSGLNCSRATDDGAAGRIRRDQRLDRTGPTQQVSNQERESEREMGLSLRSAHSSIRVMDTEQLRMNGWKGGRLIAKSRCSLEDWPRWAERGTLHLLQIKERSDACVGGIWVLEPESVLFLEMISLLTMLPVFMLYR